MGLIKDPFAFLYQRHGGRCFLYSVRFVSLSPQILLTKPLRVSRHFNPFRWLSKFGTSEARQNSTHGFTIILSRLPGKRG